MKYLIFFATFVSASPTFAQTAIYPTVPSVRYLGSNQAEVGDCVAHSRINALESAFAKRGLPVKLSLWWANAKDALGRDWRNDKLLAVDFTPEDINLLNTTGGLLPDYMWPENRDDSARCCSIPGARPGPFRHALIHRSFPKAESLGYSFKSVPVSVQALKNSLIKNEAVRMDIHDGALGNPHTGLYSKPYAELRKEIWSSPIDHSVAIVGYDDALGGFILQNSHNNLLSRDEIFNPRDEDAGDLKKFRLKIAPLNLLSYFVVPYEYFAERKGSAFEVINLDYHAFADAYFKYADGQHTAHVPYICERGEVSLRKIISDYVQLKTRKAKLKTLSMLLEKSSPMMPAFEAAKLPTMAVYRGPLVDFFNGQFSSYYCPEGKQMPDRTFNDFRRAHPEVDQLFIDLSSSPTSILLWEKYFNYLAQWAGEK